MAFLTLTTTLICYTTKTNLQSTKSFMYESILNSKLKY